MIVIPQSALHAAIVQLRIRVTACATSETAAMAAVIGLDTLAAMLAPAHAPAPLPDPHPATEAGAHVLGASDVGRGRESTQDQRPEEGGAPPAASPADPPRWSEERKALARAEYEHTTDMDGLVARLNAMPGARISKDQLAGYAFAVLGLRRPRRPAAPKPPKAPRPAPPIEETRWTEARKALTRAEYVTAPHWRDHLDKLNALPGLPISREQMSCYARVTLRLRRPRAAPAPKTTQPAAAAAQARAPGAPSAPKVAASAAAPPSPPEIAPAAPTNPAGAVAAPEPVKRGHTQSSPAPAGSARGTAGNRPERIRAPMDERDKLQATVLLKKGVTVQDVAFSFGQPIAVIEALAEGMRA